MERAIDIKVDDPSTAATKSFSSTYLALFHGLVVSGVIFLGITDRSTITPTWDGIKDDILVMLFSLLFRAIFIRFG